MYCCGKAFYLSMKPTALDGYCRVALSRNLKGCKPLAGGKRSDTPGYMYEGNGTPGGVPAKRRCAFISLIEDSISGRQN